MPWNNSGRNRILSRAISSDKKAETTCTTIRPFLSSSPTTKTTRRRQRRFADHNAKNNARFGLSATSNRYGLATIAIATIMTASSPATSGVNAFVGQSKVTTKPTMVEVDPSFSQIIQQQATVVETESSLLPGLGLEKPIRDCLSVAVTEYTSSSSSVSASTPIYCTPEEHQYSLRKVLNVEDTPYTPTPEELLLKFPKVVGHRGCLYLELENTREGFARCHDMGCEAVELDVFKVRRSSNSNEDTALVVFHGGGTDENPGDLLDYCRIDGSILDYNYETEIREKLTFNPDYAEFPCPIEKIRDGEIPTLEEVLLDAKRKNSDPNQKKMHIKIELKGPDVVEDVLDLVDALGAADMCSYSSFDLQKLYLVRQLRPGRCPSTGEYLYKTGALFNHIDASGKSLDDDYYAPPPTVGTGEDWGDYDIVERALAVGATEIHLKYDTCTKPLIDRIHAAGLGSMAWFRGPIGMGEDCSSKYFDVGNEDLAMYETVVRTGVQQLCVNKPDVLIELRERLFLQLQQQRTEDLCQRVQLGPSFVG